MKTLGKDPSGSLYLSSATNLSSVLSFASTFKDDSDAVSEALRIIANTLLLVADARTTFVGGGVAGGMLTAIMLEVSWLTISLFRFIIVLLESNHPRPNIYPITNLVPLHGFKFTFCANIGGRKTPWAHDGRYHRRQARFINKRYLGWDEICTRSHV